MQFYFGVLEILNCSDGLQLCKYAKKSLYFILLMGELHGTWNISPRAVNRKLYHCNKITISEVYLKKKTRLSPHRPWFADPCLTIIFEFLILERLLVISISNSTFNLLFFLILPSCPSFICTSKQFSLKLPILIKWASFQPIPHNQNTHTHTIKDIRCGHSYLRSDLGWKTSFQVHSCDCWYKASVSHLKDILICHLRFLMTP